MSVARRQTKDSRFQLPALIGFLILGLPVSAIAEGYRTENLNVRGKALPMVVYDPAAGSSARPYQIVVTSGDLGWVGLSVNIAEKTSRLGYRTIGFNARAYLSLFTTMNSHLEARDVPGDYGTVFDWAVRQFPQTAHFIVIGVSEGAGLAAVGMGQDNPDPRCRGIIALGLPQKTSLGWRWTDFPMWITKRDPAEPMAETQLYVSRIKIPFAMMHSTHDEWDSIDKARAMFGLIAGPKEFIAVDARNHRFSDKVGEVLSNIEQLMKWMEKPPAREQKPAGAVF